MTNARLLGALVKVLPEASALPLIKYVSFCSKYTSVVLTFQSLGAVFSMANSRTHLCLA
jgi:hypothetical protein